MELKLNMIALIIEKGRERARESKNPYLDSLFAYVLYLNNNMSVKFNQVNYKLDGLTIFLIYLSIVFALLVGIKNTKKETIYVHKIERMDRKQ